MFNKEIQYTIKDYFSILLIPVIFFSHSLIFNLQKFYYFQYTFSTLILIIIIISKLHNLIY